MSDCDVWYQAGVIDWSAKEHPRSDWGKSYSTSQSDCSAVASVAFDEVVGETEATVEGKFLRYAADWEAATGHISSVRDLISHPSYRSIIDLGWDAVPFLLKDLQSNKRFWFPALFEITNVRPFDPRDANNSRRMTEAWISWGKKKKLI